MQDQAVRKILLIQAIEETDRNGEALPLPERAEATRTVMGNNPPVASQTEAPMSSATEWFLTRRADVLLTSLRTRSPGIDHVLDVAGGATSLDRGMLVIAFIAGILLSLLDGASGINIFAPPLVLLIVWNVLIYIWLLGPGRTRGSWFGSFYARWVRARIDRLLGHSTRFNAPLTPGLRRFAVDWLEIAQPLFHIRARRLLHLSAILLAVGLIAAYYVRAFVLRSAAGWEGGGPIGTESAHILLSMLYGVAALLLGMKIPDAQELAKLRWSAPSLAGVGEPASWVYLIALTAFLYVILPRLGAAIFSTVRLWRLSNKLTLPPGLVTYVRTLFAASR
jgi:hypothetical protein